MLEEIERALKEAGVCHAGLERAAAEIAAAIAQKEVDKLIRMRLEGAP